MDSMVLRYATSGWNIPKREAFVEAVQRNYSLILQRNETGKLVKSVTYVPGLKCYLGAR